MTADIRIFAFKQPNRAFVTGATALLRTNQSCCCDCRNSVVVSATERKVLLNTDPVIDEKYDL